MDAKTTALEREMNRMLSVSEASYILGVSASTLRRIANMGEVRSYRIGTGRHRRFRKGDLLGYLEQNMTDRTAVGSSDAPISAVGAKDAVLGAAPLRERGVPGAIEPLTTSHHGAER